jgi:protein phosphatase
MGSGTTFVLILGLFIGLGMVVFGIYSLRKNRKTQPPGEPVPERYEDNAYDEEPLEDEDGGYYPDETPPATVAVAEKPIAEVEVSHSVKTNAYKVRDSVRIAHDIDDETLRERGFLAMLCDGVNFDEDTPSYISKRIMDEFYGEERAEESLQDFFENIIDKLDAEIVKFSNNGKAGTSLLACVLLGKELYIIGVGGARLYHIRGSSMKQLTGEHRYSLELEAKVAAGEIDEVEAKNHPRKNELISYIGVGGIHYIDMNDMPIMMDEGDVLLYCSDGLYNILSDSEMLNVINSYPGMFKNCAKELTTAAMDSSGGVKDDDISALMIKIGKQEEI